MCGDNFLEPWAVNLPIGWALCGPRPPYSSSNVFTCVNACVEDVFSAEQVKSWYELESYGAYKSADPRSKADKRGSRILESTTTHDSERYTVGMLWSDDNIVLPNNYYTSLVQLKSLEKRLDKDTELKAQYTKTINDDIEKGYVIRVNDCLLYTSPSPRDRTRSRMPSSA